MARARNLKPSFFKNFELADCGPTAQLLFAGLWCLADKEGRLKDQPRLIKAEIFPYYDCDVNGELTVIARLGFIRRYVVNGIAVIEVINFKKHQSPHHTEKASELPAYTDGSDCLTTEHEINGEVTVKAPSQDGGNPPDSLLLIPSSLIPDSKQASTGVLEVRFNDFWKAYPKKKSKGDAFRAWKKIKPDEQLHDRILNALELAKTSGDWTKEGGKFIPYPASWLNDEGWEDEHTVSTRPDKPQPIPAWKKVLA